jgi:hypothetical protein
MKRWHEEMRITYREWREHWLIHVDANKVRAIGYGFFQREPGSDPEDVECPCDEQPGRFRKRDAYDCGKPGCLICHGDKFPRRKLTKQEMIASLQFEEQLRELRQENR